MVFLLFEARLVNLINVNFDAKHEVIVCRYYFQYDNMENISVCHIQQNFKNLVILDCLQPPKSIGTFTAASFVKKDCLFSGAFVCDPVLPTVASTPDFPHSIVLWCLPLSMALNSQSYSRDIVLWLCSDPSEDKHVHRSSEYVLHRNM